MIVDDVVEPPLPTFPCVRLWVVVVRWGLKRRPPTSSSTLRGARGLMPETADYIFGVNRNGWDFCSVILCSCEWKLWSSCPFRIVNTVLLSSERMDEDCGMNGGCCFPNGTLSTREEPRVVCDIQFRRHVRQQGLLRGLFTAAIPLGT